MSFDKPDFHTTLATGHDLNRGEIPSRPLPETLGRAGAEFAKKGKVKYQSIDSHVSGQSELTGTVQCAFGIVHHPTLTALAKGREVLVQRFHCGCREGARGNFCTHCAALIAARYGHTDARIQEEPPATTGEQDLRGIRIRLGTDRKTCQGIYWTPEDSERVSCPNAAVIGGADTGNSQVMKSIVLQFLRQREHLRGRSGVLIFDWMGDYDESKKDFMEATGAKVRRLQKLPVNPFSLHRLERKPQLHVHVAMSFADTLARAYGLGPLPKSILVQSVVAAYGAKGITSDPVTWNRPAPTFADVYEEYCARPQTQRSDALSTVMDSIASFELFDSDPPQTLTLHQLLRGTVVIDMSGYPQELRSFAAGIMLEQLYAQMCGAERTWNRDLSRMILIDEADALLEMGCPGLEGILRRSREYGLAVVLATISPKPFCTGDVDWWKVIRTWLIHNAEDLHRAELESLLQMDTHDASLERLYQTVKHQIKLQSLVRIGSEEPVSAEDLPFFEIIRDKNQSYLKENRPEPKLLPLEGMPVLDAAHLDVVELLDELPAAPMEPLK